MGDYSKKRKRKEKKKREKKERQWRWRWTTPLSLTFCLMPLPMCSLPAAANPTAACPRWHWGLGSRNYSSLKGFLNVWMNGWVTMCLLYYFQCFLKLDYRKHKKAGQAWPPECVAHCYIVWKTTTKNMTIDIYWWHCRSIHIFVWKTLLSFHLITQHEEITSPYFGLWRGQWHPTPVLLPGKSYGWKSLVGCSPC